MKKVLFVDRDGTIIVEPKDASKSPNGVAFQIDSLEQLEFLPGAVSALKQISNNGYSLVMVTNQNGIGSATFPEKDFWEPHNAMLSSLALNGIEFEEVFICPHFKEDDCACRKPKIGLVQDYLREQEIDYANSYMIGDRDTDLQFAKNIGVLGLKLSDEFSWQDVVRAIL